MTSIRYYKYTFAAGNVKQIHDKFQGASQKLYLSKRSPPYDNRAMITSEDADAILFAKIKIAHREINNSIILLLCFR